MIPLAVFVIVWLIFVAIFLVISVLSILQMLRFGIAGSVTKRTTIAFIALSVIVIIGTLLYLSQVDLQSGFDLNRIFETIFPA